MKARAKRTPTRRAPEGRLYKRREVAAELGVCYNTVLNFVERRLLREERVPSARGHRSMPRYSRDAIDALKASGYTR